MRACNYAKSSMRISSAPFVMAPEDLEEVALHIPISLVAGREDILWPIPTGFDPIECYSGDGTSTSPPDVAGGSVGAEVIGHQRYDVQPTEQQRQHDGGFQETIRIMAKKIKTISALFV